MSDDGSRTFRVREENLAALRERIERLDRRARRLGTGPIALIDTGRRQRAYTWVKLTGRPPTLAGWRLVATVDHRSQPSTMHRVPGEHAVSVHGARWDEPRCEHCLVRRARHETYLLVHEATGELRQVGSSCMRDFVGGSDPARACRQAEYLTLAGAELAGKTDVPSVPPGLLPLDEFAAHAAHVVRQHGFAGRARADPDAPTSAERAEASLTAKATLEPADIALAAGTLGWARELLPHKPKLTPFERDLVAAVGEPWIARRDRGLICKAIAIRRREFAHARQRSKPRASSVAR